jgi:hypothetical protein
MENLYRKILILGLFLTGTSNILGAGPPAPPAAPGAPPAPGMLKSKPSEPAWKKNKIEFDALETQLHALLSGDDIQAFKNKATQLTDIQKKENLFGLVNAHLALQKTFTNLPNVQQFIANVQKNKPKHAAKLKEVAKTQLVNPLLKNIADLTVTTRELMGNLEAAESKNIKANLLRSEPGVQLYNDLHQAAEAMEANLAEKSYERFLNELF